MGHFMADMSKTKVAMDITPVGGAGRATAAAALQEYDEVKKQIKEEEEDYGDEEHSSSYMIQLHSP